MSKQYYVYILSSDTGVLYTGMTNDLIRRVHQHKEGSFKGFSKRHKVQRLIYYEETRSVRTAIEREKQIKGLSRRKKIELVRSKNPSFRDISKEIE